MFGLSSENFSFPPADLANEMGLVAVGGDLSVTRLKKAYTSGIFPWYNAGEPILWWSPNPRMVLYPNELRVSKSMKKVLRDGTFRLSLNENFAAVIKECSQMPRKGQSGTWIGPEMIDAYTELHKTGWAFSVETWKDEELVGGLYGVRYGNIASGESMFSKVSNASKAALIWFVEKWKDELTLIDCQEHTAHLASMGAREIERSVFLQHLNQNNKTHALAL